MAYLVVIDDDRDLCEVIAHYLTDAGHEVVHAGNGVAGLQLCLERQPDVIITDIVMPEKDGIGTIVELRTAHPEIKIIAISGGGPLTAEASLAWAKGIGADLVFTKPFELSRLLKSVEELLSEVVPSCQ